MRNTLCFCLWMMTFGALAQNALPTPWASGTMDDGPLPAEFDGGGVLFSTFSGVAPVSFAANSQVFTVSGGATGIPAGYQNAAADDFTIPSTDALWQIETVRVLGAYFSGSGPAESVNVYIVGNAAGLPDTTNLSAGAIYAAEGLSYTDLGTGDFEIDLPGGGPNLGPGTYWLVVQANMDAFSTGQWGWRESSAAPDTGTIVGFESGWFESSLLFGTCTGAWGARISTCGITQPPNGTANEFDLAFALAGTALPPAINVSPTAGLTTSEAGTTAQFSVSLSGPPTATVDITVASDDASEGSVSTAMLSFTSANYNIPQFVTVTGLDDAIADGNVGYNAILGPVTSTDLRFSAIDPADVSLTNFDNDIAGITISESFLTVSESGTTATFDISANTPPTDDVTIPLTVGDASEAELSGQAMTGSAITITIPSGTTAPITVTVTGLDDMIDDGTVSFLVATGDPASAGDAVYDALAPGDVPDVTVECLNDDIAGITVTPSMAEPMNTDEAGTLTPTFSVVLNTEPLFQVDIPLFASDPSEGSLSTATLTFTNANWDTPQVVTVTGLNDDIDDGDVPYRAVTEPANSADPTYQGVDGADVNMRNLDDADTTGVTVTPSAAEPLTTTEAGATDTFTVVLTSQPLFNVTIGITSDDTTEGTPDLSNLVFTAANWDTPQTVTMTGVDDAVADGDINYNGVTAAAVTNDPTYGGFDANDVMFTNLDDEMANIIVTPTSGLVTFEDPMGATDSFTVVLGAMPTSDVTIGVSSDTPSEGSVDTALLTFTPANWDTPQTVTVTGVDDDIDDGDVAYTVVLDPAVSMSLPFNGVDPSDVSVTNTDDDTVGISVSPTAGLTTSENPMGPTAQFDVVLDSEPTEDVTFTLASNDVTEGTADLASLSFTPANWDTIQTVTVTGVDDLITDGDIAYGIVLDPATSADANYAGIDPEDVALVNLDDDLCGPVVITAQIGGPITVTGTPGCVFDLYSNACGFDNTQWILIAAGISIGPDGEVTVPGLVGNEDTCYVATVTGDINQPLNSPLRTVPTLGTLGLLVLCVLLLTAAMVVLRRHNTNATR